MTLYRKDKELNAEAPLTYPDNPERYQLFFIDDDESEYAPDYDMGPRSPDEPIGEFTSLAFVANKNFKEGQAGAEGQELVLKFVSEEEKKVM